GLADSDVGLMVINGEEGVGPGDRFIAGALRGAGVPVVVAVNKIDRLDRPHTAAALQAVADLDIGDEIFPVSARAGTGVVPLFEHLIALLPEGPFFFPTGETSDQPEE